MAWPFARLAAADFTGAHGRAHHPAAALPAASHQVHAPGRLRRAFFPPARPAVGPGGRLCQPAGAWQRRGGARVRRRCQQQCTVGLTLQPCLVVWLPCRTSRPDLPHYPPTLHEAQLVACVLCFLLLLLSPSHQCSPASPSPAASTTLCSRRRASRSWPAPAAAARTGSGLRCRTAGPQRGECLPSARATRAAASRCGGRLARLHSRVPTAASRSHRARCVVLLLGICASQMLKAPLDMASGSWQLYTCFALAARRRRSGQRRQQGAATDRQTVPRRGGTPPCVRLAVGVRCESVGVQC